MVLAAVTTVAGEGLPTGATGFMTLSLTGFSLSPVLLLSLFHSCLGLLDFLIHLLPVMSMLFLQEQERLLSKDFQQTSIPES